MTNTKQDWLDELLYQNIQFTELGDFPDAVPKDRHWVNVMGKVYSFDFTLAKQAIAKQIEKEVVEARISEARQFKANIIPEQMTPNEINEVIKSRLAQLKDISTKLGTK